MNAARITCAHFFSVQMDSHQLVFGPPCVLPVINEVEDLFLDRRNKPYSGGVDRELRRAIQNGGKVHKSIMAAVVVGFRAAQTAIWKTLQK
jgi:hypothetical protein